MNDTALEQSEESSSSHSSGNIPISIGAMLVTLGVVYGDIGTSPMYVTKALLAGNGGIMSVNEEFILGALSLVIWTVTLLTTVKYVLISLRADNHGEGGIFALYSIVRRGAKWLIVPAMLGGSALLADGVLTPAVTITTAIEGLRTIPEVHAIMGDNQTNVVVITLIIVCLLFLVQRAGTSKIGRAFGPVMTFWFLFLGVSGLLHVLGNPVVIKAFNPIRGIMFLFSPHNHAGIMILGSCFLATTGAEALYSDMGHVGRGNIYATWPFVKICLVLSYLGQGAWLLANAGNADLLSIEDLNPFFQMLPDVVRPFGVVLSTCAAIIASQALITGAFSLVSEASRLDLMPHMQVFYPAETRGQLYIPMVNYVMWVGCIIVVLLFQSSAHMEAAYGLAITITMLCTTLLLFYFLHVIRKVKLAPWIFVVFFVALEGFFFISSLTKFFHGGYFTIILALLIASIMVSWYYGSAVERRQANLLPVRDYLAQLDRLRHDSTYDKLCDNLVYLTNNGRTNYLDRDILYSIFDKHPKRANAYWFVNVKVTDQPHTFEYSVENFGTDYFFRVHLYLGYKVNQRVNAYLRQIVGELSASGELPPQKSDYSVYKTPGPIGSFRFCMVYKTLAPESDVDPRERSAIALKYAIRRHAGSPVQWYGLENSNVIYEYVPLFTKFKAVDHLTRVYPNKK
ncbi:KUP/HAK/KT family potassium transporter [Collinsella tanakaei]|uniref:KUP/HAK/KT family potassium transporter n=1 Tax=Collinsella tanakaei TaxID=626935 RepID=UPI001F3A8316|nr:KUP/HAK/KT family potassium transporter [Collinsella tanakaei]MCF2621912.1 KUP/HAK/KT family potassium transporter [Collinsella tanakaei]MDM8302339.1 KUP/HAK/KT family potassium transporter [Collinsella tanakaei]